MASACDLTKARSGVVDAQRRGRLGRSLSPLLGRGEGRGEGKNCRVGPPPLTPALSPLRTGRGSRSSTWRLLIAPHRNASSRDTGRRTMRRMLAALAMLAMSPVAAMAQPRDLDLDVPPTTAVATIQITVKPPRGAVLLYTEPGYDRPIRFPGPSSTRVVPLPSRTVRIELVDGAKTFAVKILGRIDALDGAKIKSPVR
jgi:hypothetical protein